MSQSAQKSSSSKTATTERDAVVAVVPLGRQWPTIDPFLFCVHHNDRYPLANDDMSPKASLAGRKLGMDFDGKDGWSMYHGRSVPGFPQHPHRGFETVTVVRKGLIDHSDSVGATARYGGGDVQWLTAGKGVLHAEMFPLVNTDADNHTELFQIWLNLPKADKFSEPRFTMFWNEDIARRTLTDDNGNKTELVVVAGTFGDAKGLPPPQDSYGSKERSDLAIWTLKMAPGAKVTLPASKPGTHRVAYVFEGNGVEVGGRSVVNESAVQLEGDIAVDVVNGDRETEILVLQGKPIGEPVAQHGPFVMNSQAEIQQAFADYRRTEFGGWRWGKDDPVHARTETRFAKHTDGRIERPKTA
ncbi:MAG TPA: pirin-like C-terminal cupin domain-containing protein [Myxococcota bacterium]